MKTHNFVIANGDTDSIAFRKPDEKPFSPEEQAALLAELNSYMPKNVIWKNDKHYRRMIVFAAKNYVLDDGKKVTIKGNSLKATKKAPALKAFIRQIVDMLLKDKKEHVIFAYISKAQEIGRITDIVPWCFKASVTKKVLDPSGGFQKKIKAAIGSTPVSEGDKVYLFYREDSSLSLRESFAGDFSRERLYIALRKTMNSFKRVMDVDLFPDFSLKRNKDLLVQLQNAQPSIAPPTGIKLTR